MSSQSKVYGVILLVVGLVVGAIGGYMISYGQISSLQSQLNGLRDQVSVLQNEKAQLQSQIISLQADITNLQSQIEVLRRSRVIVQSEKYLARVSGVLSYAMHYDRVRSTYFIPMGQQIKIVLRMWPNAKIKVEGEGLYVHVYVSYSKGGIDVKLGDKYLVDVDSWDFLLQGEINRTIYFPLNRIPAELFGQVPIFIEVSTGMSAGTSLYKSYLLYWEVTVYDVYPP